jgi:hypothetical protein
VTMWDVLEHFVNPFEDLKKSYKIFKSNGVLIVEILNVDSLLFKISGDEWPLFRIPYELSDELYAKWIISILNDPSSKVFVAEDGDGVRLHNLQYKIPYRWDILRYH